MKAGGAPGAGQAGRWPRVGSSACLCPLSAISSSVPMSLPHPGPCPAVCLIVCSLSQQPLPRLPGCGPSCSPCPGHGSSRGPGSHSWSPPQPAQLCPAHLALQRGDETRVAGKPPPSTHHPAPCGPRATGMPACAAVALPEGLGAEGAVRAWGGCPELGSPVRQQALWRNGSAKGAWLPPESVAGGAPELPWQTPKWCGQKAASQGGQWGAGRGGLPSCSLAPGPGVLGTVAGALPCSRLGEAWAAGSVVSRPLRSARGSRVWLPAQNCQVAATMEKHHHHPPTTAPQPRIFL